MRKRVSDMQSLKTYNESWKSFLKALCVIAIPVALQNLLTTTAGIVDTVMLASLGEETVGAIGLASQLSSLMFACYWGFVGGGMLFMAQFWGARDDDGVCGSYGLMLCCMLLVGLVFTVMAVCLPDTVMRMYTDKSELWPIGVKYLRIVGCSYLLNIISMALSAMLRSTECVKIPLYVSVGSMLTNLVLNYLLIFGKFGMPCLGVTGAAIATVAAGIMNVLLLYILGGFRKHPYILRVRSHFRWTGAFIVNYLKKCFPIICNELLIGVANAIISIVYGRQSTAAIAAVAVFQTFSSFIISFFSGFTNAASILVGKEVGAGNHEYAYHRAKRLLVVTPITVFVFGFLFVACRGPYLRLMNLSGESYNICGKMLISFALIAVVRMCNWLMNDTFRSAGDPVFGTVMEISFMYVMVLPLLCYVGLYVKPENFLWVFLCAYADELIRIGIMLRHTFGGKWIKPVTEEGLATIDAFRVSHNIVFRRKKV